MQPLPPPPQHIQGQYVIPQYLPPPPPPPPQYQHQLIVPQIPFQYVQPQIIPPPAPVPDPNQQVLIWQSRYFTVIERFQTVYVRFEKITH